jgi:transcriptional regulator with XRE-family HTH domain
MTAIERSLDRATQRAGQDLVTLGREVRTARFNHDISQRAAAHRLGVSAATWSRLERGLAPNAPLLTVARALAIVGLDLHVRAFPGGDAMRDTPQLRLLARFAANLGPGARWSTEVGLPNAGDRRAWDGLKVLPRARIGVEAETRARDSQDLQRRLNLKWRDGRVDHVILLLADTRHNRDFLRSCPDSFLADFPLPGQRALELLGASMDPGGSSIILL